MAVDQTRFPVPHTDQLFIGGEWVKPFSNAMIDVIDSGTEELYFRVAEAQAEDMDRAVAAARAAFDEGPWPHMTHAERAEVLRRLAIEVRNLAEPLSQVGPRESGILYSHAVHSGQQAAAMFESFADMADSYPFEEVIPPSSGRGFGLLSREPVGVVGAIIPWNGPISLISRKLAPALLAGCTVILKNAPEAPAEGYLFAAAALAAGLPPGVLNVVTAGPEVSERFVRDPRVDKISFTGSLPTGRRVASMCGERLARCTLELGGKSPAIVLDDADLAAVAASISGSACLLSGQICSSLTRIIVSKGRHDELVEALVSTFGSVKVGDPFAPATQMGPLATQRQRDRVEGAIARGLAEGATLAAGGGRPGHLDRGWFVEPTVFAHVDNGSRIAQEEIFGPVLSVIPAADEQEAVAIANDTIYGLNASVFTNDIDRAHAVARQLRSGSVGHNAFRTDGAVSVGGFKQSGIGREGGKEGLLRFLEVKYTILDGPPTSKMSQRDRINLTGGTVAVTGSLNE